MTLKLTYTQLIISLAQFLGFFEEVIDLVYLLLVLFNLPASLLPRRKSPNSHSRTHSLLKQLLMWDFFHMIHNRCPEFITGLNIRESPVNLVHLLLHISSMLLSMLLSQRFLLL